MEDILASIRRILNEEDLPEALPEGGGAPPEDDVLVLDQSMLVAAEPGADVPDADLDPDVGRAAAEGAAPAVAADTQADIEPAAQTDTASEEFNPPLLAASPPSVEPDPEEPLASRSELMAPETAAAAASSVSGLVRTLAAGRATHVYSGGPTLEDMVRAELRPLLKEWLDTNLPPIVERLVRTEIERVVGRAVP
jgi:cell pole-organizing protein PopZ